MRKLLCMICAMLLLCAEAGAEIEMLAANVGKGDALLIRADGYTCLIDTGKKKKRESVEAAMEALGISRLDAIFLTHCDKDHTGGLKWLCESGMEIGAIYASKYHTQNDEHPAVDAAKALGLDVQWLGAGDAVALGESGAVFRVLAPIAPIPEDEDDNSLVMLLDSPDGRILLAGDMEEAEEAMLLASGQELACDVLKTPNHADGDACSAALIAACAPKLAVISTSSEEKPETPDPNVLQNLKRAGCAIYITQDSGTGISVKLNDGEAFAEIVP